MGSSKAQEKMTIQSNFARTCNRFSQFLKQRRCVGDIDAFTTIASPSFDTRGGDRDGDPAPIWTKSDDTDKETEVNKSLDLFPLTSMSDSRKSSKSKQTTKTNMTIIYDGKVIVLEDLEEETAEEIMAVASEGADNYDDALPNKNNTITTSHFYQNGLSSLPIARRASLLRFIDKRKDRNGACAPYQRKNPTSTKDLYKQEEDHQLELKLG